MCGGAYVHDPLTVMFKEKPLEKGHVSGGLSHHSFPVFRYSLGCTYQMDGCYSDARSLRQWNLSP